MALNFIQQWFSKHFGKFSEKENMSPKILYSAKIAFKNKKTGICKNEELREYNNYGLNITQTLDH